MKTFSQRKWDICGVADRLRGSIPNPIWHVFRKTANAFLAPLHFSLETGHLRSALLSRAVDRRGDPLPWYTYSAIQFLSNKDFSARRVLEWGAGQSTLFWSRRAKEVVAFESNIKWLNRVRLSAGANVHVHLVTDALVEADAALAGRKFDLIVVDGLDRGKCAQLSMELLTPDGAIIIDDAQRFCSDRADFGIIDLYRRARFSRLDFFGYSPGNCTQHCTAIFFKENCFLFAGSEDPLVALSFWHERRS
jgi:hypothetical protein